MSPPGGARTRCARRWGGGVRAPTERGQRGVTELGVGRPAGGLTAYLQADLPGASVRHAAPRVVGCKREQRRRVARQDPSGTAAVPCASPSRSLPDPPFRRAAGTPPRGDSAGKRENGTWGRSIPSCAGGAPGKWQLKIKWREMGSQTSSGINWVNNSIRLDEGTWLAGPGPRCRAAGSRTEDAPSRSYPTPIARSGSARLHGPKRPRKRRRAARPAPAWCSAAGPTGTNSSPVMRNAPRPCPAETGRGGRRDSHHGPGLTWKESPLRPIHSRAADTAPSTPAAEP